MCECDEKDFEATVRETGQGRQLSVRGTCTCPETGYELKLEPDNPGIVPHPEEVVLKLVTVSPEAGEETMTVTPVQEFKTLIGLEAESVVIRHAGNSGSFRLPIRPEG